MISFLAIKILGSSLPVRALDGIKRVSDYASNQKIPITSSNLRRAIQQLHGEKMGLKNARLNLYYICHSWDSSGIERSNLKPSGIVMHETHMLIFIKKSNIDV